MSHSLTVLQITDSHLLPDVNDTLSGVNTTRSLKQCLTQAFNQNPTIDLILITGDLVQSADISCYQRLTDIVKPYDCQVRCLPGNHDDSKLMQQVYNSPSINCDTFNAFTQWQIICLNTKLAESHGGFLTPHELESLQDKLEKRPERHTMIAMHHPAINTGSRWMDKMILANKTAFIQLISQYPAVKMVINGHIHQSFEKKLKHIQFYGTPSTCFQFLPGCSEFALDTQPAGYRIIQLHSNGEHSSTVYWQE